ncbi:MAG TPA: glycosyltransferase, partial [Ktedonobacteraceae bacterium]
AKGSSSGNKTILNAFTRALPDNILGQLTRFGLVGVLNTLIDVIVLDLLLWSIPTTNDGMIMLYNSLAVAAAALNSFCWNKYWTFKQHQVVTREEIMRFVCVALSSMLLNDAIMWVLAKSLPIYMMSNLLGANVLKVGAIAGTMSLSFIGMRLWVFVKRPAIQQPSRHDGNRQKSSPMSSTITFPHGLSVVLPAYNEEAAIAQTVRLVVTALSRWVQDFEVIVVNDGSKDRTRAIVEAIAAVDPRVCLINHATNQGCGAALASGFEAATKEFTFYMDSDGQFDIYDLQQFFPLINEYDAVFGYRINRYDTWVRKLNAWGWNRIIRFVFGLRVRDVDCAFKLYRSEFFRSHKLEARGALLLTEIVYKFARAGYTYTQVGVRHLPRRGGKGTGAKPIVIARAFYELLIFAGKWYQEELRWLSSSKESYGYASW